jgi:protein-tyrosine-phosphatase
MRCINSTVTSAEGILIPKVVVCDGATSFEGFLENWGSRIDTEFFEIPQGRIQELLCLFIDGEIRWTFVSEPLHGYIPCGHPSYRRSVACEDAVMLAARKLLRALAWHGMARLEFSVGDDGSAMLLTMSTDWGRASALAIASGVNFPLALFRLSQGEALPNAPRYRLPKYMRNIEDDLDWFRETRSGVSLSAPEAPARAIVTAAARVMSGREAWEGFSIADPMPGLRILGRLAFRVCKSIVRLISRPFGLSSMRTRHTRNAAELKASPARGTLMFVCHGNICRSPMAEYLGKTHLPDWRIHSTGLHATPGSRSPRRIRRIALELGADLEPHRAAGIDQFAVDQAAAILIMDPANYRDFVARFPSSVHKLLFLGMFGTTPSLAIPDPVDMEPAAAQASADQLADALKGLARWLSIKALD